MLFARAERSISGWVGSEEGRSAAFRRRAGRGVKADCPAPLACNAASSESGAQRAVVGLTLRAVVRVKALATLFWGVSSLDHIGAHQTGLIAR